MPYRYVNGYGPYYYRSRRIDGKPRYEHVGAGKRAALAARRDRLGRERAALEAEQLKALARVDAAVDAALAAHRGAVREFVEEVLSDAGYHRPKSRHFWRRRRGPRPAAARPAVRHGAQ